MKKKVERERMEGRGDWSVQSERIDESLEKRRRGGGEKKKGREGNQMHAQFNRFPVDPLNAALKASATNRSNL